MKLFFLKNYIIIFLLCVVSFFAILYAYKKSALDVMFTTGRIMCNTILNAEMNYFRYNNEFKYVARTSFDEDLMLDARNNLFFSSFSIYKLKNNKNAISVFGINELINYEMILEFDEKSEATSEPQKLNVKIVKHKTNSN